MGRALPSTVFSFESKKCGCAELESPDNCCDDQLELVKIENDQSAGPVIHLPAPDFNFICELFFEQPKENSQRPSFEFAVAHDLPPPKIPIYQRICSLVFYESVI